ncbi:MAG: hypothetical protein ACE145_03670 [Terriglobia bacterium]
MPVIFGEKDHRPLLGTVSLEVPGLPQARTSPASQDAGPLLSG